ncbi:MAG: hypothetical protein IRD7MM_03230 [Candidatus Midichloria mitochondrii]
MPNDDWGNYYDFRVENLAQAMIGMCDHYDR